MTNTQRPSIQTAPTTPLRKAAFSMYPVPGEGGVGCAGEANNFTSPEFLGYTMITTDGMRFTEWTRMRYNDSTGAFEPQWANNSVVPRVITTKPKPKPKPQPQTKPMTTPVTKGPERPACPTHNVFELYNHTSDPGEMWNLAANPTPELEAIMAQLREQLHSGWQASLLA